jgi:hypothetical protein
MTALDIAIGVLALLVMLTAAWRWKGGNGGASQLRRRHEIQRRREERDLL